MTTLTYKYGRNLFTKNKFKPFVYKYFKDIKFIGFESGNMEPSIQISNWEEIKDMLPKYALPMRVVTMTENTDGCGQG